MNVLNSYEGTVTMQTIEILDIKNFMQLLFQVEILDGYHFVSAAIQTDMLYSLDGHINKDFFNEEELSSLSITEQTYLPWSLAKEKVFMLIKGKKTPSQLKVVLRADSSLTETLLSSSGSSLKQNDIDGMFLNIMFQQNKLHVTCGASYNIFTMDKTLETEFATQTIEILKKHGITCA